MYPEVPTSAPAQPSLGAARAYLFVPADRPERFDKACAAGADAVIVDLEDAVAPERKSVARAALAGWLSARHPVLIRINAVQTPWFADDLALLARPGVAGVVLPKAEDPAAWSALRAAAPTLPLLPLIETALGFAHLRAIAAAPGVTRLLFGSIDLQLDLGIHGDDGDELLYYRTRLVLAARLAGLAAPVDGVCAAVDDAARLERETRRAWTLGFGGKLCIHPRQIAAVRAGFGPSAQELAWAERVLAAAEQSGGGAVAVDGAMVDAPVLARARALVAEARKP